MAVLDTASRYKILGQIIRDFGWAGFTKVDIQAVINAVDDWADANSVSYNNALPLNFKTNATAAQKALILAYVCMRRAGVLKVEGE